MAGWTSNNRAASAGTGITNFLENGGTLEAAARIADHASTKTTQLYDRRRQILDQAEVERIRF